MTKSRDDGVPSSGDAITRDPFPASRKVYVPGSIHPDIRVPMREIELTPTRARHIVSALVQKGYVRFGPHPNYRHDHTVGCWTYHPNADH